MNRNIVFSCVVDDKPKFKKQCNIWVDSLIYLAQVSPNNIYIHLIEPDCIIERFLKSRGVNVIHIKRWGDEKYCNKLAQFNTPSLQEADYVFLCDSDLAFCYDITKHLQNYSKFIVAKPVDMPNPPLDKLAWILLRYGITHPKTVDTLSSQQSFIGNCNGGLYGVPKSNFVALGNLWKKFAKTLLADTAVLEKLGNFSIHIDQISFCLAIHHGGFLFKAIDSRYNCPTHLLHSIEKLETDLKGNSPFVLHFHDQLTTEGLLKETGSVLIDNSIKKINKLIKTA